MQYKWKPEFHGMFIHYSKAIKIVFSSFGPDPQINLLGTESTFGLVILIGILM